MSLHSRHLHGRAIFGDEAIQHLAQRKREVLGDNLKMIVPEGYVVPVRRDIVVDTVVANVFVTLPQSFTGSPDGFSTIRASATSTQANGGRQTGQSSSSASGPRSTGTSASRTSTATFNPATTHGASIVTATSSLSSPYDHDSSYSNSADASRASSSNSASSANGAASGDIGTVAKVGIAVGAIVALAMLGGLLFFCMRRKKKAVAEKNGHNEKYDSMFGAKQPVPEALDATRDNSRSESAAPRLSLRPVTQFLPNLNENRKSGDMLNAVTAGGQRSAWERKPGHGENPFADSTIQEKSRPVTPNANPFEENQPPTSNAAVHTDRSVRKSSSGVPGLANAPVIPPTAVVVGAMGPGERGSNNVHRVQLDFKPSMDDELELRSGQLVRMLHEYDDGWALCVRMDRSQQGVCPRTCLSKLPVKPRQGPPPNARPNGPGPQGPGHRGPPNGRPQMPAASNVRPDSSQMFNGNGMYPRPLTPTGNSDRAESPSGMRKPVPGQAF